MTLPLTDGIHQSRAIQCDCPIGSGCHLTSNTSQPIVLNLHYDKYVADDGGQPDSVAVTHWPLPHSA
jgi:hypothetical protein